MKETYIIHDDDEAVEFLQNLFAQNGYEINKDQAGEQLTAMEMKKMEP